MLLKVSTSHLQQTGHMGTALLSGPITAGMSRKISSSALTSRFAIINLPTLGDLPFMKCCYTYLFTSKTGEFNMTFYRYRRAQPCRGPLSWAPWPPPAWASCCHSCQPPGVIAWSRRSLLMLLTDTLTHSHSSWPDTPVVTSQGRMLLEDETRNTTTMLFRR